MYQAIWQDVASCKTESLSKSLSKSVVAAHTSIPCFLEKDYVITGQLGWVLALDEYLNKIRILFTALLRLTCYEGNRFFVIDDSYVKRVLQFVPQPARVIATEYGTIFQNDLILGKSNASPVFTADRWRLTHQHILLTTEKVRRYLANAASMHIRHYDRTNRCWRKSHADGGLKKVNVFAYAKISARRNPVHFKSKRKIPVQVKLQATGNFTVDCQATLPLGLVEPFLRL
jgi:hypothetical protein